MLHKLLSIHLSTFTFAVGLSATLSATPQVGAENDGYTADVKPSSDEASEAARGVDVADGFDISVFAAEPQLANPVCLYVDYSGDLYVSETFRHHQGVTDIREHMDWLDADLAARTVQERLEYFEKFEGDNYSMYSEHHDRIRWISDSDGDGVADQDAVYAEGFNDPAAGIGAGLLFNQGQVYYTCIPDLWSLRDTDGDHRADERKALSSGYGVRVALLGHDLHGLRVGPDGLLYFSCGDRGFSVKTQDETIRHYHTGAVLRCELDGSNLEVFATGLRNPQELAFDEYGNLWTGDNNSDGGDKARWVYVVEGSDSGWRQSYQWIKWPNLRGPWNAEKLWHPAHEGQAAYLLPPVANLGAGPSGLCYNPGTGMPAEYDRHFFMCDFRGDPSYSGIHAFDVSAKGAGFELGEVDWLAKNTLCTDVDFGPDGSLYVSDWVAGWNRTGKGRVFRLTAQDEAVRAQGIETSQMLAGAHDRGMYPDEKELSLAAISLLGHPDQRVRQEAHLSLARQSESTKPLLGLVSGKLDFSYDWGVHADLAVQHALWALQIQFRRGQAKELDLSVPANSESEEVRAQTARVLGETDFSADLLKLVADPSPRVAHLACLSLGKRAAKRGGLNEAELQALTTVLANNNDQDPVLRHSASYALVLAASEEQLSQVTQSEHRSERMAAVIAYRRRASKYGTSGPEAESSSGERLAGFLADTDPAVVSEAASAIYDLALPAGLPALAGMLQAENAHELAAPVARRALNAAFTIGDEASLKVVTNFALKDSADEVLRQEALRLLGRWQEPTGRDGIMGEWRELDARPDAEAWIRQALESMAQAGVQNAPTAVARDWIELASKVAPEEHALRMADWALDLDVNAPVRTACLRALKSGPAGATSDSVKERLRSAVLDQDADVRAAAMTAVQRIMPKEAFPLFERALKEGSLPERRSAYAGLGQLKDEASLALLAGELERSNSDRVAPELLLDLVIAAEARKSAPLDALLSMRSANRDVASKLTPYLDGLLGGNAERGRTLFLEKNELSCLRCHQVDELDPSKEPEGHPSQDSAASTVGPALMGVGSRLSRLDLLDSIVHPNARITTGFAAESFFLTDGEVIVGRVISESESNIAVIDSDGAIFDIVPSDIDVRKSALSAMPEGLEQSLSRQEMRDLIEFLSQL